MTIATGSRHNLSYVLESTFGTTPANPSFTPIRHTGTTLGLSKDSIESEELREDRQVAHYRHGNKSVTGDVNFELSYGGLDALLEATLCGTWATNVLLAGTTRRSYTIERHHQHHTRHHTWCCCEWRCAAVTSVDGRLDQNSLR